MKFVSEVKRTHLCGDLRKEHVGQEVVLMGWVDTRRDHGSLVFVDLRDREGLAQVVLNPAEAGTSGAKSLRNEFVVAVKGTVRSRPKGMVNKKVPSGEVEVEAQVCEVLSTSETPPIHIGDSKVSENLRLKYRYLEIRSAQLQKHLIVRHKVAQIVRNFLSDKGFLEIETPILYKSTPEGARDYLVPSRVHLGHFYALPQSPQTLKQLLMLGGVDRYFQIARCFRDEDLRADRQPEFSQIDLEMSFVDMEDVMTLNEDLVRKLWKEIKDKEIGEIPRISYHESMSRYGSDRPDLRNPLELKDLGAAVKGCGFKVFEDILAQGGAVRALAVPKAGSFSRNKIDKLIHLAKQMGAKGLVWIKSDEGGSLTSSVAKFFEPEQLQKMFNQAGGERAGAVFIVADEFEVSCHALSALRDYLGHELGLVDLSKDSFLWVVDFPLLEFSPDERRWIARHHPFTSPKDEHIYILFEEREKEYSGLLAKAYDFVCNGHELAGGSIRIHNQQIQRSIFKALGMSDQAVHSPGNATMRRSAVRQSLNEKSKLMVDRLIMILCDTDAIRDVIAFPKTAKATCLMSDAPSTVSCEQLLELGIRLGSAAEKSVSKGKES